jgi:hypothetical protein
VSKSAHLLSILSPLPSSSVPVFQLCADLTGCSPVSSSSPVPALASLYCAMLTSSVLLQELSSSSLATQPLSFPLPLGFQSPPAMQVSSPVNREHAQSELSRQSWLGMSPLSELPSSSSAKVCLPFKFD